MKPNPSQSKQPSFRQLCSSVAPRDQRSQQTYMEVVCWVDTSICLFYTTAHRYTDVVWMEQICMSGWLNIKSINQNKASTLCIISYNLELLLNSLWSYHQTAMIVDRVSLFFALHLLYKLSPPVIMALYEHPARGSECSRGRLHLAPCAEHWPSTGGIWQSCPLGQVMWSRSTWLTVCP